jgi:hypothetical protein
MGDLNRHQQAHSCQGPQAGLFDFRLWPLHVGGEMADSRMVYLLYPLQLGRLDL